MTEARMQETPEYKPGTFCWVELGTTDGQAAKKFYTELFGWTFTESPVGPGMVYAMAKELGATLLKEPFDVMTVGRMAVVQDPTGAVFALWQARTHKGAGVVNVPNSFCWNELATPDTEKAGDFYAGLFGWGKNVQQMGQMTYTSFMNGDRPAGGMYKPGPEMGNVPPHWLVYFAVDDTDAKLKQAGELGGKTRAPAMDIPGTGRFAIVEDPQGAVFGIIKLEKPPA